MKKTLRSGEWWSAERGVWLDSSGISTGIDLSNPAPESGDWHRASVGMDFWDRGVAGWQLDVSHKLV